MLKVRSRRHSVVVMKRFRLPDTGQQQGASFANYKEHIQLKQVLEELDRGKQFTYNQIAVDQKVLFRRFNRKLTATKLKIAKSQNDRDTVEECRSRLFNKSFASSSRQEKEEQDLHRLLQVYRQEALSRPLTSSSAALEREKQRLISGKNKKSRESKTFVTEKTTVSNNKIENHIDTVHEVNSNNTDDKINETIVDSPNISSSGDASTDRSDQKDDTELQKMAILRRRYSSNAGKLKTQRSVNFFADSLQDASPKLSKLDLHKELAQCLRQEDRVRHFCDRVGEMRLSRGTTAADYYAMRLNSAAIDKSQNKMSFPTTETPQPVERSVTIVNMTFKPVTLPNID